MSSKYSCIIIEDEPLAQNILKKYIDDHPALELSAVFPDALEAQSLISQKDIQVVDYLLKPFSFERFLKAVNKVSEKLSMMKSKGEQSSPIIFIKADKKVYKVDVETILYIESTGDYLKIYTTETQYLIHSTLKNFLEELPSSSFLQVHKSFIIAKNKIVFIEGNYVHIAERDIPIGASYKEEVSRKLKSKN